MQLIKELEKKYVKKNVPELKAGDVIKVHQKIQEGKKTRIQIFEGIVIKTSGGHGINGTYTVRRKSFNTAVEITFPLHSPSVVKVEKTKQIKVRKSRLYYLRDLTDKQIRRKEELTDFVAWEEKDAQEEEEQLKAKLEEEAKKKEAEKLKEEKDLENKFESAQKSHEKLDESKEGKEDDKKDQEAGK